MSTVKKRPVSPRQQKKKKLVQNQFELVQFKKMIGKGLVTVFKGSAANAYDLLKDKILSGGAKSIAMTGFVSGGVIYIFDGVDRLLAINSISYADIKKHKLEIDIIINQYSNMSMTDLT